MSGSAKAGTIAERHACELRVLPEFAGARSSEARFRRIFFSLTKTYMEVGKQEVIRFLPDRPDSPANAASAKPASNFAHPDLWASARVRMSE